VDFGGFVFTPESVVVELVRAFAVGASLGMLVALLSSVWRR